MRYLKWTERDIGGLEEMGLSLMWTEINTNGQVVRELGFDSAGRATYRAPTREDPFGLFDSAIIARERTGDNEVDPSHFEEVWQELARSG